MIQNNVPAEYTLNSHSRWGLGSALPHWGPMCSSRWLNPDIGSSTRRAVLVPVGCRWGAGGSGHRFEASLWLLWWHRSAHVHWYVLLIFVSRAEALYIHVISRDCLLFRRRNESSAYYCSAGLRLEKRFVENHWNCRGNLTITYITQPFRLWSLGMPGPAESQGILMWWSLKVHGPHGRLEISGKAFCSCHCIKLVQPSPDRAKTTWRLIRLQRSQGTEIQGKRSG